MIAYLKLCCVRELDFGTAFYLEVNNVVVDLADQGYTGLAKACVFQVSDQTAVRVCWDCPNSDILVPASPTHLISAETGVAVDSLASQLEVVLEAAVCGLLSLSLRALTLYLVRADYWHVWIQTRETWRV
jgi:hypothetical protein